MSDIHEYTTEGGTQRVLYPCVIVPTRYGGTYEGGRWAAYAAPAVPQDAVGDDIECTTWWSEPTCLVGVGDDPGTAYVALVEKVGRCTHPRTTKYGPLWENGRVTEICDWCGVEVTRREDGVAR